MYMYIKEEERQLLYQNFEIKGPMWAHGPMKSKGYSRAQIKAHWFVCESVRRESSQGTSKSFHTLLAKP